MTDSTCNSAPDLKLYDPCERLIRVEIWVDGEGWLPVDCPQEDVTVADYAARGLKTSGKVRLNCWYVMEHV